MAQKNQELQEELREERKRYAAEMEEMRQKVNELEENSAQMQGIRQKLERKNQELTQRVQAADEKQKRSPKTLC